MWDDLIKSNFHSLLYHYYIDIKTFLFPSLCLLGINRDNGILHPIRILEGKTFCWGRMKELSWQPVEKRICCLFFSQPALVLSTTLFITFCDSCKTISVKYLRNSFSFILIYLFHTHTQGSGDVVPRKSAYRRIQWKKHSSKKCYWGGGGGTRVIAQR